MYRNDLKRKEHDLRADLPALGSLTSLEIRKYALAPIDDSNNPAREA